MDLTKEELKILITIIHNTQVAIKDAPKLINLANKLAKMVEEDNGNTPNKD